jgi:LacI family transcriptional regulator
MAKRQSKAARGASGEIAPKARPTLRTIAELTGLGVTTVSRALKDGPELSALTKQRVRNIANELGYLPHRAGVRLKTGKTFVISFVLNQADDMGDYAKCLIMGISEGLRGTHYHLQVLPQTLDQDPMMPVRYIVETAAADGLILTHTEPQDMRVKLMLERGFPFITFGQTELASQHPFIDTANYDFAYRATKTLIERGRRRIMFLSPPSEFTYAGHQRGGYMRALYEAGGAAMIPNGIHLYTSPELLRVYARQVGNAGAAPDGVVCGSEAQALGLMLGFQDAGLTIGEDIEIAVKKTSRILDLVRFPILQFSEDLTGIGRDLAHYLLRHIDRAAPVKELQRLDATVLTIPN